MMKIDFDRKTMINPSCIIIDEIGLVGKNKIEIAR